MDLNEYQKLTGTTAVYGSSVARMVAEKNRLGMETSLCLIYTAIKLNGEAGEIAEHIGKMIRDDRGFLTDERREALIKELGDVLWYASQMAIELGMPLNEVAVQNIMKLQSRKDRGVLKGSGSER